MPDNSFYTLLTKTGAADLTNAQVFGLHVPITKIAIGDGGGQPVLPVENVTALAGEKYRLNINSVSVDPENPDWLVIEAVIPANTGGWTIREIGLIGGLNSENVMDTPASPGEKLLAYGNFPETYKPLLAEGAAKDLVIRMIVQVANASLVQLTIDPSVVVATQRNLAQAIQAHRSEESPHPGRYTPLSHTVAADPHPQYFNEVRLEDRLQTLVNGTLHYVGQVWQIVADAAALADPAVTGPDAGRADGARVIVTAYPDSGTGHALAVWDAEGEAWLVDDLALSIFDLYGCDIDDHGYYWFADGWNLLDLDNIGDATEETSGVVRLAAPQEIITPPETPVVATAQAMRGFVLLRLRADDPLPDEDIGPLWHDFYNSFMTWQSFKGNGAGFEGYASVLVGSLLMDTQQTARAGYIASGITNLSRTTYAALRAWALHNGRMVSSSAWKAGSIVFSDNSDGTTFRVYDIRGEFTRVWDNGRGVDSGRTIGSWEKGSLVAADNHSGVYDVASPVVVPASATGATVRSLAGFDSITTSDYPDTAAAVVVATAGATLADYAGSSRPRNVALAAYVKF